MPDEQSVEDMVDEVLARQAAYRASQAGESFEDALDNRHRNRGRAAPTGTA